MTTLEPIWALIVAGGRGARAGGGISKQYRLLGGLPMLARSIMAFLDHPSIAGIQVVIGAGDLDHYHETIARLPNAVRLAPPVFGGAARQDSVRAGLDALYARAPGAVLIHDAARPFVTGDLIARVIAALADADGAIAAVPVADTLKREEPAGHVGETVDRGGLWRAQTPQGFRFAPILAAHRRVAGKALTDDAAVAAAAGLKTVFVTASERNLKITRPEDFALGEALLAADCGRPMRTTVGQGYDVHRLGPGDGTMLCGVFVAGGGALIGHSDADVGLHALTDAVLGALGAGDIGDHFPPTDERWRGASSDRFLAHAASLVAEAGGRIAHLDVTLVCEAPKIKPHREAMRARIASIVGVALSHVSVKATTTEQLGFTGRREGIAAQAAATLCLPDTEMEPDV